MPLIVSNLRPWTPVAAALFLRLSTATAFSAEVLYQNDFEKEEVGKIPTGFTILDGAFTVREEGGNKFLELPGSPLDAFGLLFGPPVQGNASVSGRFFGTKEGRKFPAFGISLNGVSGYRLQVSAGKKSLEIFKGDESKASVPFSWASGAWTRLRLRVRKSGASWTVDGRAWPDGSPEPAEWTVQFDDSEPSSPGRAGIWGSPFSSDPIRFDDLSVEKIP